MSCSSNIKLSSKCKFHSSIHLRNQMDPSLEPNDMMGINIIVLGVLREVVGGEPHIYNLQASEGFYKIN